MKENLIVELAPKIKNESNRKVMLKKCIAKKEVEVKRNSFLEPFDVKSFRRLNAMPPLGLSSASRIGKG